MGRRTCEKPKVRYRKGLWSPEEDERLRNYILRHGHGNWSSIPAEAGLQRNGKSCRLRWLNYLRPGLKRGIFSPQEVATVVKLHSMLGNKWSQIALHLPGRTDNEVKNYWNSYLKKKVVNVEGSESHASTPNSENSTNQNKKSMQLSEESNNQISLSGCSGSMESCSGDSFRSRQHMMKNVSHQATHLPKLLFADWISMDHAKSQSLLYNSDGGMTCPRVSTSNTKVNGTELLQDNLPSTYDVIHEFGDISNYGEFKWQFDRGEPSSEGSIFDLLPLVENCSDFQMSHDITF